MDWNRFIAAVISWPVAAIFIALLFKSDLRKLADKVSEVGLNGIKLAAPPQQEIQASPTPTSIIAEKKPLLLPPPHPVIFEVEERIRKSLKDQDRDHLPVEQLRDYFVREYAQLAITAQLNWSMA